jgi:NAD(P)-dependent dehydrogenase (short-subunit alcohol dehydrogenase family)
VTTNATPTGKLDGFDLTGKRALVVGAETRAGRAIAAALAEAGARLTLADTADTGDDLVRAAVDDLGGLDVVVSCADARLAVPFEEMTDEDWDHLIEVNLTGPVHLLRAAARAMIASGGPGRLIQVVSMLGERGVPNTAAYGATQAALLQLIRTLSLEWARKNIRINGIGLGWIEGDPMLDGAGAATDRLLRYLPTKRFGRPDEIGAIAVYLASDRADMMTGQTLWVDGAAMSHA